MWGAWLAGNLYLAVVSSQIVWDFGLRYASRVGVAGSRIRSPCLVVPEQHASGPKDGCIYIVREGYGALGQPKFECDCWEILVFRVRGVWQNLCVFSLYCNPDLDDLVFHCLLTPMAAMQAENVRASFLFVGDLNGHHQEWLGSTTTNRHSVAAFNLATVSGCGQLVVGPTHARGSTLDLLKRLLFLLL